MDTFARGLLAAADILSQGYLNGAKAERYNSFDTGIGAKFESGEATLEELEVNLPFTCGLVRMEL